MYIQYASEVFLVGVDLCMLYKNMKKDDVPIE